jgi:hypothetical protein
MSYEIIKDESGKASKVEFENFKHLGRISARIFQYLVERPGQTNAVDSVLSFVYDGDCSKTKKRSFDANICINVRPMCDRLGYSIIRTKNKIKLLKHGN